MVRMLRKMQPIVILSSTEDVGRHCPECGGTFGVGVGKGRRAAKDICGHIRCTVCIVEVPRCKQCLVAKFEAITNGVDTEQSEEPENENDNRTSSNPLEVPPCPVVPDEANVDSITEKAGGNRQRRKQSLVPRQWKSSSPVPVKTSASTIKKKCRVANRISRRRISVNKKRKRHGKAVSGLLKKSKLTQTKDADDKSKEQGPAAGTSFVERTRRTSVLCYVCFEKFLNRQALDLHNAVCHSPKTPKQRKTSSVRTASSSVRPAAAIDTTNQMEGDGKVGESSCILAGLARSEPEPDGDEDLQMVYDSAREIGTAGTESDLNPAVNQKSVGNLSKREIAVEETACVVPEEADVPVKRPRVGPCSSSNLKLAKRDDHSHAIEQQTAMEIKLAITEVRKNKNKCLPCKCKICGKAFPNQVSLQNHEEIH